MTDLKRPSGIRSWGGNFPALACIVLLGALIYANTLHVPWYLDDYRVILENPSISRLQEALGNLFSASRGPADLTFAINYKFNGKSVTGYHLVNIAIHLITSCLVFLLLKRAIRSRPLLALGGALIFVAHPLQTQAVTYIVQRMTSLAGLFFFLALYLYVRAREATEEARGRHWLLYSGALFCGALAVFTKQNTAILPLALILFDRYFLPRGRIQEWHRLLLYVAPFCLVPGWLGVKSLVLPMLTEGGIENVGAVAKLAHLKNLSPINYLVTEFSVIWLYLRLLFVPYGQALEYDFPIAGEVWTWQSGIALLGIAVLFAIAAFLRKRNPVVSAGILLFFLGLAVESTIIPLDPVFEHRLYIPMFGFALVVMGAFALLPRRAAMAGIVLIIAALGALTWQRNALWNDPLAFYQDNLRQAPGSERVHLDLGVILMERGRLDEAQRHFEQALEINPDYVQVHINLSRVLAKQENYSGALTVLQEGVRRDPSYFILYNNLGALHNLLGQHQAAVGYLQKGLAIEPENAEMHFNIGLAYDELGLVDEAVVHYRLSIRMDDQKSMSHFNLGVALYGKGERREALQELLVASRLDPDNAKALYNAAVIYLESGDMQAARQLASSLERVDSGLADQLGRRISEAESFVR